jgi:hypothetical protein
MLLEIKYGSFIFFPFLTTSLSSISMITFPWGFREKQIMITDSFHDENKLPEDL